MSRTTQGVVVEYGRIGWFARVLGLGAAVGLVVSHLGCGSDTIVILPTGGGLPTGPNINGNGNQIGDNNTVLATPTPTPTATGV